MRAIPSTLPVEARIEAALARLPGLSGRVRSHALAVAPVASPMHRGVASDGVRLDLVDGASVFLKIHHEDCAADVTPHAAEAVRKAAARGVTPALIEAADGALALAWLDTPWRYARVGDLQDAALLAKVLAAKKVLHVDGPIGHRVDPFARLASLFAEVVAAGAPLPDDTERLVATCALIGEAVEASGIDLTFCHNDGVASNVMLHGERGDVLLVDFDLAGDNDPWFDVGALINEACRFEADERAAIEAYAGACEERVLNRCRLYGIVDDTMWGLWGLARAAATPRPGIEFHKYGTWRLSHAHAKVAARGFETWLRRL
ncbi:phosphotransferase family protein [Ancylobacter sp.]|uniref:phosphotransferase family protein n=1 Tax=Ancylobacter sp. TaxID=1872567 RepID=UPI003D0C8249